MTTARVCLNLVAGREIQGDLFDYLSGQPTLVSGFTASDAEGHGPDVRFHTTAEQVKGRADRVLIRIVLNENAADELIQRLDADLAGSRLIYWTTPILRFGVI